MHTTLQNALVLALQHPAAFTLPDETSRCTLLPGDCAFLSLTDGHRIERFWVRVAHVLADGTYRGRLANQLECFPHLQLDDPLNFHPDHVLAVVEGEPDTRDHMQPVGRLRA